MSELNIEVGKKYNCRSGDIAEIDDYVSTDHYCFIGRVYYKNGLIGDYSWTKQGNFAASSSKQNLDLISEHIEDIQLVVGHKYKIEDCQFFRGPYLFFGNLNDYKANPENPRPLIFINKYGEAINVSPTLLREGKIKEHIEKSQPYEVVVYASYDPTAICRVGFTDKIMDLYVRNVDRDHLIIKAHAKEHGWKVAKITSKIEPDYQGE